MMRDDAQSDNVYVQSRPQSPIVIHRSIGAHLTRDRLVVCVGRTAKLVILLLSRSLLFLSLALLSPL